MAKKSQPTDIPPGGMLILQASTLYPTAEVLQLADAAFAAYPELGQSVSREYRSALLDLKNALPCKSDLTGWTEATGEPVPTNLGELTRQAARAGFDAKTVLDGQWTPRELLPGIRGALEREHALRVKSAGNPGSALEEPPHKAKFNRHKRASVVGRPLTPRQAEAVQIIGECKGDVSEAARRLKRDRSTVAQHYFAAMRKLGKAAVKHATRSFPRDRRGQVNIVEGDDRRR